MPVSPRSSCWLPTDGTVAGYVAVVTLPTPFACVIRVFMPGAFGRVGSDWTSHQRKEATWNDNRDGTGWDAREPRGGRCPPTWLSVCCQEPISHPCRRSAEPRMRPVRDLPRKIR